MCFPIFSLSCEISDKFFDWTTIQETTATLYVYIFSVHSEKQTHYHVHEYGCNSVFPVLKLVLVHLFSQGLWNQTKHVCTWKSKLYPNGVLGIRERNITLVTSHQKKGTLCSKFSITFFLVAVKDWINAASITSFWWLNLWWLPDGSSVLFHEFPFSFLLFNLFYSYLYHYDASPFFLVFEDMSLPTYNQLWKLL